MKHASHSHFDLMLQLLQIARVALIWRRRVVGLSPGNVYTSHVNVAKDTLQHTIRSPAVVLGNLHTSLKMLPSCLYSFEIT